MSLGDYREMQKEPPSGPADAPGDVGMSVEELEDELSEALKALSSGLCSAHRKPDPLHCDTCNKVAWLTSTNLERMKQIDSLREQLGEALKALLLAQKWLANSTPIIDFGEPYPLPAIAAALSK